MNWLIISDTNESKELLKFCRKFTVPLRAALRDAGVLANYETPKRPVVHVFFIACLLYTSRCV